MQISPAVDNWVEVTTHPSSQGTVSDPNVPGPISTPPPEYFKVGPIPGTSINSIFQSNNPPSGSAAVYTSQQGDAGQFRNDYGVWGYPDLGRTNKTFNRTYTLNFTKSGYYLFEGAVDDTGLVKLDGTDVFAAMTYYGAGTTNGFGTPVYVPWTNYATSIYVTAGNHTLYYEATNTVDIGCMALKISYYGDTMYTVVEQINQIQF
jgi:hypothetical protein